MDDNNSSKTSVARLSGPGALREVGEFLLQPTEKLELLRILGRPKNDPATANFITTIEREIAKFLVVKELDAERKRAADSRNALKRLANAVRKLSAELGEIPGQQPDAYFRLSLGIQSTFCFVPPERPEPPPWDPDWAQSAHGISMPSASVGAFVSLLLRDLQALEAATARALKLGKDDAGGQHVKAAQTFLARGLAQAFHDCLDEGPSSGVDGRFEQVLRLCLKAGGEEDVDHPDNPRGLHALVLKTLTSTKPPRKKEQ